MRTIVVSWVRRLGVLAGVVLGAAGLGVEGTLPAQEGGQAHRMLIQNGSSRTVHYFANGLSEGERITLRDLEQAENKAEYVTDLLALRRQYVHSERLLEPQRRATQEDLYGTNIATTSFGTLGLGYGAGLYGSGYAFGSPYTVPFNYGGYTFGYPANAGLGAIGATSTTVRTLAFGVGDQGPMKNALAGTIAQQATPEYTAAAVRNYEAAVARASESGPIRVAMGLSDRPGSGRVAEAAFVKGRPPVTLIRKEGERIEGSKMRDEGDWYIVERANDEVQVRKSEVTRITRVRK
jgi:hypothetical protein